MNKRMRRERNRLRRIEFLVSLALVFSIAAAAGAIVPATAPGIAQEPTKHQLQQETHQEETPAAEPVKPVEQEQKAPAIPRVETLVFVEPNAPQEVVAEPETVKNPGPTYTEEELEALALVIYQEAGGDMCSDETRLMVGAVVLNRVADDRFPDTLQEVLTQKAQYGRLHWTGLVWPERASLPEEAHAVERAYNLAEALLGGTAAGVLPADVVWQAEFVQGTEVFVEIDGFYFCR